MSTSDTVKTYFESILYREPSPVELSSWTAVLGSGAVSMDQFSATLLSSPEMTNFVAPVLRLYQATFNRVPESAEAINFYADQLRTAEGAGEYNAVLARICQQFSEAPEFITKFGGSELSSAFITALYINVLGRPPEPAGLAFYMDPANGFTPMKALLGFTMSPEFQSQTAAAVERFLTSIADGSAFFSGPLKPAGAEGETFTLTTSLDDLTGTGANDTFNAPLAKDAQGDVVETLDDQDLVNGGGGHDTANLTIKADHTFQSTAVETVIVRNIDTGVHTLTIASDVTTVVEAKSTKALTIDEAKAVTSVISGGVVDLKVNGLEQSAVTVTAGKAESTTITLSGDATTNKAALSELTVNFTGKLDVAATTGSAADSVTKLAVNARGDGTFAQGSSDDTSDHLTFTKSAKLTSVVVAGKGDLDLSLGATQAKLASFDASGLSGGVKVDLDGGASSVLASVKGGAGNDELSVANLKDGGSIAVGSGDDSLEITAPKGGYTVDAGAGNDTITAAIVAGKATVINAGDGSDEVSISGLTTQYADAKTSLTVDLGAGDDFVDAGDFHGAKATLKFIGGAGVDTIRITGEYGLAEAKMVSGFEKIDVTGNADTAGIDMSGTADFKTVVVETSLMGAAATKAILNEIAAGTDVYVSATKADRDGGELTYKLADATGKADTVLVTLDAKDGNDNGSAEGNVTFKLTANGIETVKVAAIASVLDADKASTDSSEATKAADYTHDLTLVSDVVKVVDVTGGAHLNLTLTGTAEGTTIDATGSTGGVTVTLNADGVFKGGAGDDVVTAGAGGGAIIHGGAGADTYEIAQTPSDVLDTIVFSAALDSQLRTKTNATTGDVEPDLSQTDTIGSFGANDKIDLTAFSFTGARADVVAHAAFDNEGFVALVQDGEADFFKDGTVAKGVAEFAVSAGIGSGTYIAIDANKDGNFNAAQDMVVKLGSTVTITSDDFIWGA